MNCPACQRDNPPDARFCTGCGATLELSCAACGAANPADSRFCKACGKPLTTPAAAASVRAAGPEAYTPAHLAEKILTSRSALEGERKLVTVLFVDVSGFTALSEQLDPEDVHQLMDRAFEAMLAEVHHYEGTVNQFLGDGLMALFGAPIAHEDHPVRAVHAALGIQRKLAAYRDELRSGRGIEFQARMGLNTGAVVVGTIGDNLRMDYTAVGDTTNLAARLLALAEPGHMLIGEHTAKAVEPYFVLEALGEVAVKGKALPVRAFRVKGARGARSRLEAVMERGLTPLVGRERELALLQDRFAEVLEGRGQAVFVLGEPGIGKSRLLLEFRRQVEASAPAWLVGRCVSYGRAIPYLPVLDVVRALLGIVEGDDVGAIELKVDDRVRAMGEALEWTRPFLRALLSLDPGDADVAAMNPHQRRGRTVDALREILLAESRRHPLVVLVEDLHWIDSHSEEVVRRLLEGVAAAPVLVLLSHRPGYAAAFGDQTYYTRVPLHRLTDAHAAGMVEGVLQATGVPAAARELIARRAEGNPLFVEELTRALVEEGTLERANGSYRLTRAVADVAIPDTIQGVIMARIDRLPEVAKTALQVASVIGREFSARLLERLSAAGRETVQALGELRAVELIYEKSAYPEVAYLFKHALTHDVAYESLLRQRRRALHRRAGEVIEELYPDRLAEFYETLAWHFTQGEAWDKAAEYLLRAARKAREHYAYAQAVRFCTEAVDVLERQGGAAEDRAPALEALGDLHSLRGDVEPANEAYERALEAARDATTGQRVANKRHRPGVALRDGARIAYYQHGGGEPTLLLMQPLFYGLGTYQPLVEALCQEFRIVTVDPRGAGRSDPLPGPYLLRDHVEDARAVIEAVGDRPIVFVGISRAGQLAVNFAATYPHLVERLVLIANRVTPILAQDQPGQTDLEFFKRVLADVRAGNAEQAMRTFWTQVVGEAGGRDLVESLVRSSLQAPFEHIKNFFLTPDPGFELRHLLATLRVPTLILHGAADRVVPVEAGHYQAAHIPGAQLYIFQGRGHALFATATAEFAQVVSSFVRTGRPT